MKGCIFPPMHRVKSKLTQEWIIAGVLFGAFTTILAIHWELSAAISTCELSTQNEPIGDCLKDQSSIYWGRWVINPTGAGVYTSICGALIWRQIVLRFRERWSEGPFPYGMSGVLAGICVVLSIFPLFIFSHLMQPIFWGFVVWRMYGSVNLLFLETIPLYAIGGSLISIYLSWAGLSVKHQNQANR